MGHGVIRRPGRREMRSASLADGMFCLDGRLDGEELFPVNAGHFLSPTGDQAVRSGQGVAHGRGGAWRQSMLWAAHLRNTSTHAASIFAGVLGELSVGP